MTMELKSTSLQLQYLTYLAQIRTSQTKPAVQHQPEASPHKVTLAGSQFQISAAVASLSLSDVLKLYCMVHVLVFLSLFEPHNKITSQSWCHMYAENVAYNASIILDAN